MDFGQSPLLVIWETSQACDLACRHCRACALPDRNPFELTTEEGYRLLDEIKSFGHPMVVFTGGDPLKRPDIFDLMEYGVKIGLRCNISPSATPLLTAKAIDRFKACGLARMAISLDGPDAETHDTFRGVPGSFEQAMAALRHAQKIGLDTQLQTTVTRHNVTKLGQIAELAADAGIRMWSLFFLVVTGRAQSSDDLTGEEYERVFEFLYEISKIAPFEVKTTEAMHYRRYIAQRLKAERHTLSEGAKAMVYRTAGVSDGKGFVFVSHIGEIYPSGFLPISAGNVRRDSLVDVYRNAALFRALRDSAKREGKCGACEYQNICGGSRSRAYACTGNYLGEDPRCTYQPTGALEVVGA
ncbi:MAG: TIGR04053 family radical SAM/SPASM domain-containing protein [Acidobacteria bacterium]|nr:TIGR04053 family radical SAM/SPASM domain-containing protein [Acidobacteriota bacterium]